MSVRRLTTLAVFAASALVLYLIEMLLPTLIPIPGVKLGLANIITLFVLLHFKPMDAFYVLLVRILLSGLFAGQVMTLFYSGLGGLACFLIMTLFLPLLGKKRIYLISILGALAHNAGQLTAAFLITHTAGVFSYLPFLILSGIFTGLFTGLCAFYAEKYLLSKLL